MVKTSPYHLERLRTTVGPDDFRSIWKVLECTADQLYNHPVRGERQTFGFACNTPCPYDQTVCTRPLSHPGPHVTHDEQGQSFVNHIWGQTWTPEQRAKAVEDLVDLERSLR